MPRRKTQPAYRIDAEPQIEFGGVTETSEESVAPPPPPSIEAPESVTLVVAIDRSALTPTAQLHVSWSVPPGSDPTGYLVQWSTSSTFPANATGTRQVGSTSTTIGGLRVNTLYYVRVKARYRAVDSAWSDTASATTPQDSAAPGVPTAIVWSWSAADLVLTWTNPTDENYARTEIKIYSDATKTTLYDTQYSTTGRYVWSFARQTAVVFDVYGVYDPAVFVELRSLNSSNYASAIATPTTQPSNAAPPAPTVLLTGGQNVMTAQVTSAQAADFQAYEYTWKRDGVTVRVNLSAQSAQVYEINSAADAGLHTWSVVVRQRDLLGQYSGNGTSGSVVVDGLLTDELRSDIEYDDNVGTDFTGINGYILRDTRVGQGIVY